MPREKARKAPSRFAGRDIDAVRERLTARAEQLVDQSPLKNRAQAEALAEVWLSTQLNVWVVTERNIRGEATPDEQRALASYEQNARKCLLDMGVTYTDEDDEDI